jgi:hypothetical protein
LAGIVDPYRLKSSRRRALKPSIGVLEGGSRLNTEPFADDQVRFWIGLVVMRILAKNNRMKARLDIRPAEKWFNVAPV